MRKFNPGAEHHPCMRCLHGGLWNDKGQPAGNVCKHPVIVRQKDSPHARHHTLRERPGWCPIKEGSTP